MKFLDIFKSNSKIFLEDPISKKEWIEHFYSINLNRIGNINDEDFDKLKGKTQVEIMEIVRATVMTQQINACSIKTGPFNKNITVKGSSNNKDSERFLVRFIENIKGEDGIIVRYKQDNDKRKYLSSPSHTMAFSELFEWIEEDLVSYMKICPSEFGVIFSYKNKGAHIEHTDGLRSIGYFLKDRLELYKEYPEIDKSIFKTDFKEFINHILTFKDTDIFDNNKEFFKEVEESKKVF